MEQPGNDGGVGVLLRTPDPLLAQLEERFG
jgi:hypothetical protein